LQETVKNVKKKGGKMKNNSTNPDGGLIDAHNELGKLVAQVGHWLYIMYDGHLGQRKIVHILSGVESMTQKDLQNILGIKPSSMSEIITKLEKKGDIVRNRDEFDRRKVVLKITESGLRKDKYQQKIQDDPNNGQVGFDVLTSEEQQTLRQLLEKILVGWEQSRENA